MSDRSERQQDIEPGSVPMIERATGGAEGVARLHLNRRELLAWGGAAAALPSLAIAARAQQDFAATAASGPQPMSVGYIEGSDTWAPLRNVTAGFLNSGIPVPGRKGPSAAEVSPASSLISGAQDLAGETVRVRVHGLYPVANPTNAATVYATAFFSGTEAGLPGPVPFLAWGYKSVPVPDVPPPTSFVYPLGAMGTLDMQLDVVPAKGRKTRRPRPATSSVGGRFTTTFTVDWFAGKPKLQRGVYLLGLGGSTWSAARTLPILKANQQRPLELLSLIVSFEKVET